MINFQPSKPAPVIQSVMHQIRIFGWALLTITVLFFISALNITVASSSERDNKFYTYEIIKQYPHNPNAFTQGLVFSDRKLFESTGLWGKSSLREVDLETGNVKRQFKLDNKYFGEGLELIDNKLYQLTWKSGLVFVYDSTTFELLDTYKLSGDGWGLTEHAGKLVKSDGTSRLTFLDPDTMTPTKIIEVLDGDKPIDRLNELELIDDIIYANVYQTDKVVMISPLTGNVVGTLDLSGLLKAGNYHGKAGVLNGIAYDEENDRVFVTGKNWPWLFEIRIKPAT